MKPYRGRKKRHTYALPINIGIGILFLLFFISLGLILAINLRFLYYADIKWFGLEDQTGLSYQVIKQNYNALIDYCSPFFHGDLVFPSLAASASGLSHFAEVKVIFNAFYVILAVTFVLLLAIILYKRRQGQYSYLRVAGITCIVLPVIVSAGCLINFNATFTLMHKLFFRNDDWLFDPETDPIINLLPEKFFLQCAVIIILAIILGCILLFIRYHIHKKQEYLPPLIPPKVNYFY